MQIKDTSKIYPCWRTYKKDDKLPVMTFHNGRSIDLSTKEVASLLDKMPPSCMLMFYDHLYYGGYQPCSGQTSYIFGSNFSISLNDDGSICVFGNGCLFE